ncbi:hypothetical protein J6590_101058 [Homalodisca vitripennis]|nr:hypothetical protein J6590_101058 [Homalodisca vitripennis]
MRLEVQGTASHQAARAGLGSRLGGPHIYISNARNANAQLVVNRRHMQVGVLPVTLVSCSKVICTTTLN